MHMAVKIVSTAWKLPVPLKNAVRCAGVNAHVLMNESPRTIFSRKTKTFSPMMVRFATAGRVVGYSLATGKSAMRYTPYYCDHADGGRSTIIASPPSSMPIVRGRATSSRRAALCLYARGP
jgi:hypothetical protein